MLLKPGILKLLNSKQCASTIMLFLKSSVCNSYIFKNSTCASIHLNSVGYKYELVFTDGQLGEDIIVNNKKTLIIVVCGD